MPPGVSVLSDETTCAHGEPLDSGVICPACERARDRPSKRRPRSIDPVERFHGSRADAQFAGRCPCGEAIKEGDPLRWDIYEQRWVHADCMSTAT